MTGATQEAAAEARLRQPAHYRTRNDLALHQRARRRPAEDAAAAAAAAAAAVRGGGGGAGEGEGVALEMVETAQLAALQAFGAGPAMDVAVEGLLASQSMRGIQRYERGRRELLGLVTRVTNIKQDDSD